MTNLITLLIVGLCVLCVLLSLYFDYRTRRHLRQAEAALAEARRLLSEMTVVGWTDADWLAHDDAMRRVADWAGTDG